MQERERKTESKMTGREGETVKRGKRRRGKRERERKKERDPEGEGGARYRKERVETGERDTMSETDSERTTLGPWTM